MVAGVPIQKGDLPRRARLRLHLARPHLPARACSLDVLFALGALLGRAVWTVSIVFVLSGRAGEIPKQQYWFIMGVRRQWYWSVHTEHRSQGDGWGGTRVGCGGAKCGHVQHAHRVLHVAILGTTLVRPRGSPAHKRQGTHPVDPEARVPGRPGALPPHPPSLKGERAPQAGAAEAERPQSRAGCSPGRQGPKQ